MSWLNSAAVMGLDGAATVRIEVELGAVHVWLAAAARACNWLVCRDDC